MTATSTHSALRLGPGALSIVIAASLLLSFGCASTPKGPTGSLLGIAVDGNGNPLPGITVSLNSAAGKIVQEVLTSADGSYRFEDVPVGQYQVQLATSRERNRLARELHDTLAHTLSGLSVQLETIKAYWDVDSQMARSSLDKSLEVAHSGLEETRRALKALRASPFWKIWD